MVLLDLLQLVGELGFLLHVAGLLFTPAIAHLLPSIVNVILIHRIIMAAHAHTLGAISVAVVARLLTLSLSAPLSTFVRVLGYLMKLGGGLAGSVVTLAR